MRTIIIILLIGLAISASATKVTTGTPGTDIVITSTTVAGLSDGDTLQINAGRYTGFSMTGVHKAIKIIGTGVTVDFNGSSAWATITTCSLFSLYDIYFYHGNYRGLELAGNVDSCLIKVSFRNFRDYVLLTTGLTYAGTAATRNNALDIQITSDSSSGAPVMHFNNRLWNSYIQNGTIDSVFGNTQTIEFTGGGATTSVGGGVIVRNITFTHCNKGGTNHNCLVYAAGEWEVYNITALDYQGDAVRLRPYTMDSSASHGIHTSVAYNIWGYGSDKYSICEIQHLPGDTTTNTNLPNIRTGYIWFFNCSGGRLRDGLISPQFEFTKGGCLMTLENSYRSVGNLIYNLAVVFPRTDADQSTVTSTMTAVINDAAGVISHYDTAGLRFYKTWSASGFTDSTTGAISSTSPLVNAGTPVSGYGLDAFGRTRPQGSSWDIGRIEAILNSVGPVDTRRRGGRIINKP